MILLSYSFWFTIAGVLGSFFVCRLVLLGTIHENELLRYFFPALSGALCGYVIGLQTDRIAFRQDKIKDEQTALRSCQQRERALFEKNQSAILIIEPKTSRIVEANPAAAHFYGYPLDGLIGLKMTQICITPANQLLDTYDSIQTGETHRIRFKQKMANSEIRDVESIYTTVTLGEKQYLLAVMTALTEVRLLRGLLPVCPSCGNLRDDEKHLKRVEEYLKYASQLDLDHARCPTCARKASS